MIDFGMIIPLLVQISVVSELSSYAMLLQISGGCNHIQSYTLVNIYWGICVNFIVYVFYVHSHFHVFQNLCDSQVFFLFNVTVCFFVRKKKNHPVAFFQCKAPFISASFRLFHYVIFKNFWYYQKVVIFRIFLTCVVDTSFRAYQFRIYYPLYPIKCYKLNAKLTYFSDHPQYVVLFSIFLIFNIAVSIVLFPVP